MSKKFQCLKEARHIVDAQYTLVKWRAEWISVDDLKAGEWGCGKFSRFQTWCQDEVFRFWEPPRATLQGTCSPPAVNLERPLSLVAPWVLGILCLGDSLFMERQGAASSEFMFWKRKLLSVGKKRIRTSRPQLPWKAFSAQVRRPRALLGPLFWAGWDWASSPRARGRSSPVRGGNLVWELKQRSVDAGLAAALTPGVTSGNRHVKGCRFWERASSSQRSRERYSKPSCQWGEWFSMCWGGAWGKRAALTDRRGWSGSWLWLVALAKSLSPLSLPLPYL